MSETVEAIVAAAMAERALQRPLELAALVEAVIGKQPRAVLEIGTFAGGTLRCWCQCATDDAILVSVDMPGGPGGGGYDPERANVIRGFARAGQELVLIEGDSHAAETRTRVKEALRGRKLDFLFIDGDHTYEGVKADFEDYRRLVRRGGLIAFHDIAAYPEVPECQVERFWREDIRGTYDAREEFIFDGEYLGCGIGLMVAP